MAARRKQVALSDLEENSNRPELEEDRDGGQKQLLPLFVRRLLGQGFNFHVVYLVGAFLVVVSFAALSLNRGRSRSPFPLGYAVAEPETCGNDEERVVNVLRWAVANGAHIHPNISTGLFDIPGKPGVKIRGVLATGKVREREKIFSVPTNLLLNIQKMEKHHWLGPIYAETPQLHDSIGGLALLLLVEALNASSFYRPYLCSLPLTVPLPVFYRPGKLEKMKGDLPVGERGLIENLVEARRDVIQLHYMKVMPTLFLKYPALFPPEQFSYERWAWAVSLIMSRTWGRQIHDPILNKKTGTNTSMAHTLAPGADMPNHNASAYEAMQDKEGRLVLVADRNVTRGDQVYISYGAKCNAEFLAHYGFIPGYPSPRPCKQNATHLKLSHDVGGNVSKWRQVWRRKFQTFLTIVTDKRFRNSKAYLQLQSAASNPGVPTSLATGKDDAAALTEAE
mmetsp:Transcript_18860/g.38367  ORF Transcript_18860/g.38367 Transcript_18860/m.38367 type:complete len:451 (+) Transcript_18860:130-1482(+)|eukprot:CAMPEP_0181288710 /NCGR_PEP_ID=MMETSP1101-20121128/485_1 /TAXON_ID=46948 /ORGANISM="Rhodomonas abbreviata, Strain Caron Lab Isolate" /LENGTH=450 /DNA_ID=CAMNT_0023392865 /DNA_START=128 /DNA_END=1480 /DNA_ORIENTATION=+